MKKPKVAILAVASHSGEIGGAERMFTGLCQALCDIGLDATVVAEPGIERDIGSILDSYRRFYDLDLSRFDGVISAKAPSYAARHPNHICYLMHTMRVFYDMFDQEFPDPPSELCDQRCFIQSLDTVLLSHRRLKGILAIGAEVAERLERYNGIQANGFMRHPSTLSGLYAGRSDYIFLPGRLHRWKRVDLAIDAVRRSSAPLRLVIAGDGEDMDFFRRRAGGDCRIEFMGRVSEQRLVQLYADAVAVAFVPRAEDLGLVTLEAFGCGKPVITCTDSGEPARIVRDGVTGYVCPPDAVAIAGAMEAAAADPVRAEAMGAAGRASVSDITWENVARKLASMLGFATELSS